MTSTVAARGAAVGLGVAGALAQTTSGVLRLKLGLLEASSDKLKLGALDVGGGVLWLGWDLANLGQPWFLASYVVLMVGREGYANREALQKLGRRLADVMREGYAAAAKIPDQGDVRVLVGQPTWQGR